MGVFLIFLINCCSAVASGCVCHSLSAIPTFTFFFVNIVEIYEVTLSSNKNTKRHTLYAKVFFTFDTQAPVTNKHPKSIKM